MESVGIMLAVMLAAMDGHAQDKGAKAGVFKDTKNGYFMFLPPTGWTRQEYDDPRTKVQFNHASDAGVLIRFIVREAAGETYDAMIREDRETASQMKNKGISCEVMEREVHGLKCSEVAAQFPEDGGTLMLRKFLSGGLHFNIQYGAPTKAQFEKHRDAAMRSLDTITVLKIGNDDPKKAREQQIAGRIRLAKLTAEWVSVQEARQVLEEARKEFPDSESIRDALRELEPLTEAPALPRVQTDTYTVRSADTLWSIAEKELGSGERWKEIHALNKDSIGDNPLNIHVGQVLKMPPREVYGVRPNAPPEYQYVRNRLVVMLDPPPQQGAVRFGLTPEGYYCDVGDSIRFKEPAPGQKDGALDLRQWDLVYILRGEIEVGRRFSRLSGLASTSAWLLIAKMDGAPSWPLMDTQEPSPRLRESVRLAVEGGYELELQVVLNVDGAMEYTDPFGRWKLGAKARFGADSTVDCRLVRGQQLLSSSQAAINAINDGPFGTELICAGTLLFFKPESRPTWEIDALAQLARQQEQVISRLKQELTQGRAPFATWDGKWPVFSANVSPSGPGPQTDAIEGTLLSKYSGTSMRILYSPCRFVIPLLATNAPRDRGEPSSLPKGQEINVPKGVDATANALEQPRAQVTTYTVQPSDVTLVWIAKNQLGDAKRWPEIYALNREAIGDNPLDIHIGQLLKLPERRARDNVVHLGQATGQVPEGFGVRDIADLLAEKQIEVEIYGSGIETVDLRVRRLTSQPVGLRVPVGTFFVSDGQSSQDMVTTRETKLAPTLDCWIAIPVDSACANRSRDIPASWNTFAIQRSPYQGELARLMPAIDRAHVSRATGQAAVWIVTDDATYSQLGSLLVRQPAFPADTGTRAIQETEAAAAMRICDDAGIDITRKRIWGDRLDILKGLKDDGLKSWLGTRDVPR
jgi:nucleoid-associated protein YgaU